MAVRLAVGTICFQSPLVTLVPSYPRSRGSPPHTTPQAGRLQGSSSHTQHWVIAPTSPLSWLRPHSLPLMKDPRTCPGAVAGAVPARQWHVHVGSCLQRVFLTRIRMSFFSMPWLRFGQCCSIAYFPMPVSKS